MKFKLRTIVFAFFLLCGTAFAFSDRDIISPSAGVWGNVQALVLDAGDGSDLYYSLTGSDPLVSGFAYDGPVVIDGTGDVSVNITAVAKDGTRSDFSVSYSVKESEEIPENSSVFIHSVSKNPIRKYISGTEFSIPKGFLYSLSNSVPPSYASGTISLSAQNQMEVYVPCTISDGKNFFHFVIHVIPDAAAVSSASVAETAETSVPFTVRDWNNIQFTGDKLLYQIDDEYWSADKSERTIDRTVPHTIRWQSMEYMEGNPVGECVLPVVPALLCYRNADGMLEFLLFDEGRSQLSPVSQSLSAEKMAAGLYSSMKADIFDCGELSGTAVFDVYQNGVRQGTLSCDYSLDKIPPAKPVFSSSSDAGLARDEVVVTMSSETDSFIFYSISGPVESETAFLPGTQTDLPKPSPESFEFYSGQEIRLRSPSEKAALYKVSAFASDAFGNRSPVSEYTVVVDKFNYYISGSSTSEKPDGTYGNPFSTFDQALEVINSQEYMRLFVVSDIKIETNAKIESDCDIIGGSSRIEFAPSASLEVSGAKVLLKDCLIECDSSSLSLQKPLVSLKNGASLSVNNCEIIGLFDSDAVLFDCAESSLNVVDSGLSVQSRTYGCVISSQKSDVSVSSSRITAVSETGVGASCSGGKCLFYGNEFFVIASMGRALEFYAADAGLENNNFSAVLRNGPSGASAVWKDADTVILQNLQNKSEGF